MATTGGLSSGYFNGGYVAGGAGIAPTAAATAASTSNLEKAGTSGNGGGQLTADVGLTTATSCATLAAAGGTVCHFVTEEMMKKALNSLEDADQKVH